MRNIIIAKLIKDLPDIKAGALFTSLSKDHWNRINDDEPYDFRIVWYFYDDQHSSTSLDVETAQTFFDYTDLKDWCHFFDYSCGKFLPHDDVKAITLAELETLPLKTKPVG